MVQNVMSAGPVSQWVHITRYVKEVGTVGICQCRETGAVISVCTGKETIEQVCLVPVR